MSIRKQQFARVLFGCLLLAACNEENPAVDPHDDDEEELEDGGEPANDGGRDGGTPGGRDAGGATGGDAGHDAADGGASAPVEEARFFLSTGEHGDNISPPTVVLDGADNAHLVYPAYAGGGAYYAFCAAGSCASAEDMEVVKFATDGTAYNTMIALTDAGQPRVLINAFYGVYYATCDADCGDETSWSIDMIVRHDNKKEVTGSAFTLDRDGHPRFLMHTYRALLGIGQEAPQTELVACDANCAEPASWTASSLGDVIWYGSALRIDANNGVHVATTLCEFEGRNETSTMLAYFGCTENCSDGDSYQGVGFGDPYESSTEAVDMHFTSDLELTKEGQPRVALILKTDVQGEKAVVYGECNEGKDCGIDANTWSFYAISRHSVVGEGTDLALDANDRATIAYTFNYNVLMRSCGENCTDQSSAESPWSDGLVEAASSIPTDDIFLWPNCSIGAWLLSSPSVAVARDGSTRVAYESRDISGGFGTVDPTRPACTAGTDMVLGRYAVMPNE